MHTPPFSLDNNWDNIRSSTVVRSFYFTHLCEHDWFIPAVSIAAPLFSFNDFLSRARSHEIDFHENNWQR